MGSVYSVADVDPLAQKPPSGRKLLPLVGEGEYTVGCADLMVEVEPLFSNSENNENFENLTSTPGKSTENPTEGLFMRIFYPCDRKEDRKEQVPIHHYPIWKPDHDDYVTGLANYQGIYPTKMHIFYDWLIGEKRIPAGWHYRLFHSGDRPPLLDRLKEDLASELEEKLTQDLHNEESLPRFPVVVFSHGISGNRFIYSIMAASIASHGYIVAVVEHRDNSASWTYQLVKNSSTDKLVEKPFLIGKFPYKEVEFEERCQQTAIRTDECLFVLKIMEALNFGNLHIKHSKSGLRIVFGQDFDWTQFKGRLDLSKTATIGHSFGACSSIAATTKSYDHLSFKATVVFDGWLFPLEDKIYKRVHCPILFLNASQWQWRKNVERMLRMLNENNVDDDQKFLFTFKDISHQGFSDFSIATAGRVGKYFQLQGELDPEVAASAVVEMTVKFLDSVFNKKNRRDLRERLCTIATREHFTHFISEGTDIPMDRPGDDEEKATNTGVIVTPPQRQEQKLLEQL